MIKPVNVIVSFPTELPQREVERIANTLVKENHVHVLSVDTRKFELVLSNFVESLVPIIERLKEGGGYTPGNIVHKPTGESYIFMSMGPVKVDLSPAADAAARAFR